MLNPLINIKQLSDDEIQKKMSDIHKKILQSSRSHPKMREQLQSMLLSFQLEMENRKTMKNIKEDDDFKPGVVYDSDRMNDKDNEYDDLIDIS